MYQVVRAQRVAIAVCLIVLAAATCAWSQQISGSISGVVKDSQQSVIGGAKVILVNSDLGINREAVTGADGTFVFTQLPPAPYNLVVEMQGFKKYEQKDIRIYASDRIAVPDIVMELGQLAETVLVEAQAVQLQTQSAERSGVITGRQVTELAVKTRNFLDLAATVPGVNYRGGLGGICANGSRCNQNNLQVDGVTNVDTGSNGGVLATMNVDQIGEFKLMTNSQPAEIGRSSGAAIQVVTKSGTREFHGTGYWFHRNEGLNANNWRNNMEGRPRNLFRYNYEGYNIGGPILLPFTQFNKDRSKLFFFWSQEFQNSLVPNSVQSVTVPTAAERTGDFSQTKDSSGKAVTIKDPLTGLPFPDNKIPTNRLSADGIKILSFYPLPNRLGVANDYNYQTQLSDSQPRREQLLRGDYNISEKWRVYSRYIFTKSEINKAYGQWNANYNIPYGAMNFGDPGWSFITNLTTVINPTLTNEFIFGSSKNKLNIDPVDKAFDRSKLGLSYTMPFPNADPLNLVQNWRFNVPNSPFTAFNGTPFRNFNHTFDYTDNISKVYGVHTFKAGIYVHRSWKDQTAFTSTNGDIYFDTDSANPGDTGWSFANAALGNYQRVAQSNTVLNGQYRDWNVEWFVQDNWKITPKLTLDLGIRFYWIQPQYDEAKQTSSFNPALYDPSATAILQQRAVNPATNAAASYNPITGTYGSTALIGTLIPNGKGYVNGLYANGMGLAGQNGYPLGLIKDRGVHWAPRLGIAYQLSSKTVIRTGGGVFYDRFQGNPVFDMLPNPPSTIRPTFYYGNLATLGQNTGVFAPAGVRGFSIDGNVPTTYNFNFSVQRELPGRILADVGYVGSRSYHQLQVYNLNTLPFGSAWLPQNQDPTKALNLNGLNAKPINLYRPYPGYGDINITEFGGKANYNSLQVSLNRRFATSFMFGMAYTWSKALGTAGADGDTLHPTNFAKANYGPLFYDVPHLFVFNYTWDLPKFASKLGFLDNPVGRLVLNNWEISGITTFAAGEPDFINIDFLPDPSGNQINGANKNRVYTGSESVGPRPYYSGNPNGKKDIMAWVDPSMLRAPIIGQSTGQESGQRPIRKPGISNWDVSVFKNIPIMSERRYLQLRCEMFNAPNHTQFSDFNRTVNFDKTGAITNLPGPGNRFGFGAVNAARDPRIIQLAAKFYF